MRNLNYFVLVVFSPQHHKCKLVVYVSRTDKQGPHIESRQREELRTTVLVTAQYSSRLSSDKETRALTQG